MSIIKNNYELLIESYFMMGYIYSQFGQEVYSLNIYVNLKQLMSCKGDINEKLKITLEMSSIMSKLQKRETAVKLLKQALCYAWYLKKKESEIEIYELLGLEYYNMMEIEKASYYHNRSINFEWEEENSISFQHGIGWVQKTIDNYQS